MAKNIFSDVCRRLNAMLAIGKSKHQDKLNGIDFSEIIYSTGTKASYERIGKQFARYCLDKYGCTKLSEARVYVDEWLLYVYENYSAYTSHTYKCALAKLFQLKPQQLPKPPVRRRADITRCRKNYDAPLTKLERDNLQIVNFCEATGLRRRELMKLRGKDIKTYGNQVVIHITRGGKGGLEREVHAIKFEAMIKDLAQKAGDNKLFPKIPKGLPIHKYRARYAHALYKKLARHRGEPKGKDRYVCSKDMKGIVLDRRVMLIVSRNLGHQRIDVIAQSYLYGLYLEFNANQEKQNETMLAA